MLIVDDNESNRTILHHLISGWGMQDGQARNATEALEMLTEAAAKGEPYDAAVPSTCSCRAKTDCNWPKRSGAPQGAGMRLVMLDLIDSARGMQSGPAGPDFRRT
ncbi:MAG: hypothetical protein MRJ92_05670 [Nitrospira sp.]|nr:hypothetical protein [Nitrospira sp.]